MADPKTKKDDDAKGAAPKSAPEKNAEAAKTVTKSSTLVAKVALKGDFELPGSDDGLGSRAVEVSAGDEFKTGDAALAKRLVEQGFAKVKGAKDDGTEPANPAAPK